MKKNWKTYKLGELVDEQRGISYGIVQPGEFLSEGGVPILKVNNLTERKTEERDVFRVNHDVEKKHSRTRLQGNEILVSLVGSLGFVHKVTEKEIGWNVVRAIGVLPIKNSINRDWVYWSLRSPDVQAQLIGKAVTTVQSTLNIKELKEIEISIPESIEEQIQISSVLSSLDDKIALNNQMSETLEVTGQSIFREWFVNFNLTNLNKLTDELPIGWKRKRLGEVIDVKGGTTPSTTVKEYWDGENYWSTPKDLSNLRFPVLLDTERQITMEGVKQISSGILPKGTLLLSSRAPVGYLAISQVPVSINQGYIAIQGKSVSNLFMLFWLKQNMETVKSRANGSTFQEISKTSFKEIEIVVPEESVLKQFDEVVSPLFERIIANEEENRTLKQIRDNLLPKLMSGKINV